MTVNSKLFKGWVGHLVLLSVVAGVSIACQSNSPSPTGSPTVTPTDSSEAHASASPSPETTPSNQDTYRNDRLGFQFTYPAGEYVINDLKSPPPNEDDDWVADIDIWTQEHDQEIRSGAYEGGTEYPANVHLTVRSNPQQLSLREWVEQSNLFGVLTPNFTDTTIAGQDAIAFESSGLYENENVVFSSPDGANIIVIGFSKTGYEDNDVPYQRVFEQVVDSFEFVDG